MATNPFPLNISAKIDSEDKLAQTAGIPENQKIMAAEFNKIPTALDYLFATSSPYKCYECDFVNGAWAPFVVATFNGGILDRVTVADPGRLGQYSFSCAGTNSGASILLGGSSGSNTYIQNMSMELIIKRSSATTMMARAGFCNGLSAAAPSSGVYFEFTETGSYAYAANSGVRTLVNLPNMVSNTWYRIVLTTTIDRVAYFEMYNAVTGVLLGSTTITTNIPTAAFITAIGIAVHNNASGAGSPMNIDYINVKNFH